LAQALPPWKMAWMDADAELWKSWQDSWPDQKAGHGCPLCAFLTTEDPRWGLRVFEGRHLNGYLWRPGAIAGYCVAIWKHHHVAEPTELDDDAAAGYWLEVLRLGRALETVYQPAKMNYQTLGNAVPHLHTHLIPRPWRDPAPHGPLPWTYLDDGLRTDEVLDAAAQRLRAAI